MKRNSWSSKIGFIFAAAGSAIGLANIWRFPYIVGQHGGAAFILIYLLFLALAGLPILLAEVVIGRSAQKNPSSAFAIAGENSRWGWAGKMTIATGVLVSGFYSAVAGWVLGYLVEALKGSLNNFSGPDTGALLFKELTETPAWGLGFHFAFIVICSSILYLGVRKGIEQGTKVMMPLLFAILLILVIGGLSFGGAKQVFTFLFSPDWSALSPTALLIALGQSFFTLSLGQGTMVTYGSYLDKKEAVVSTSITVIGLDLLASLLAAIAVFSIAFASGLEPGSGPSLIFQTLPWAFSQLPGGYFLAVAFFLLVSLAAITSQISVMEPLIAYLCDEKKFSRHGATAFSAAVAFLLGVPAALYGRVLELMEFACSSVLIPLGGLMAALLVGWRWKRAFFSTQIGVEGLPLNFLWTTVRWTAPVLILLVFLHAVGLLA